MILGVVKCITGPRNDANLRKVDSCCVEKWYELGSSREKWNFDIAAKGSDFGAVSNLAAKLENEKKIENINGTYGNSQVQEPIRRWIEAR